MDKLRRSVTFRKKAISGSLMVVILVSLLVTGLKLPLIPASGLAPILQWSGDLGTEALGLAIGDVDNDGTSNELVVMTRENVQVLKWNMSSSAYEVKWSTPISVQSSEVWKRIIIEDTDNDGLNEIAISAFGSSPALTIGGQTRCAFVYEWNGTTYVLHSTTPQAGRSTDSIAVGDVDNDGKNEVIVGTTDGYYYGHIRVLEWNDTTSTYIEEWSYGDPVHDGYENLIYANHVKVGDADNDGYHEIIAGDRFGHLFALNWNGTTYQAWVNRTLGYGWDIWGIAINDADNDDDNEIVMGTDARIGSLQWNEGSKAYVEYDQINLGSNLMWFGIAVGEVDYDGKNELIAGNTNGEVYVFKWDSSNSNYTQEWSTDIGDRAWDIAIGDADNDGYNEFVVGNYGGEVFIYKIAVTLSKDVLIINDPHKYAYFGWYSPTQMSQTIWELLNRTILWASSYLLPNETRIVLFRESGDSTAAEVYDWLISGGYPVENITLHPTTDVQSLPTTYYKDTDLVIYWNRYGYDSRNIVNAAVPFITVSTMQTDEMGIGIGITTLQAYNDTFYIVNNNYYPTDLYALGPLLFDDSYPFEATAASTHGKVLITAEVESVSPNVEMSVTQDVVVLADGSANIAFNITIPESPLADILRETFFTDASSLDPDVEYDVPDNKTVGDEAAVEEAIKDVSLQGDVSDGDGQVELEDLEFIARIFGYMLGDEEWDAELDVNWDGKIDMRDVAAAAHNYGKTVENTGGLYVAGYYDGLAVNCTDVYYRGPEGSARTNMSEAGHIWYSLLPGNYTVYGKYETSETSTNVTVTTGNVTYAQLDFGGEPPPTPQTGYEPVKDVFYQGIVMEQLLVLGFDLNVIESKIVPWSATNETIVKLTAYAPQLAYLINYPNWSISIGPWDENSTTMASEFVFTKIQYMMQMLQSFPGDQYYVYNWQMGIELPPGAELLNGGELSGLNWTIDFGGGTYMQANVTLDSGRIIVDEVMKVTEQSITASEEYLAAAFGQYKIFSINYSLIDGPLTQIAEGISKPEGDWSSTWSKTITPGSYVKSWSYGSLTATLKITPTLTAQWYVGWEKKWSWGGLKLKWFKTWIKVTPSIKVEASVTAEAYYSKSWSYSFWTWSSRFYFWVGAVPVWANLKLKVTGDISVTIHGKVSLSTWATVSAWYKGGVKYENGWSTIWEHGSGGSYGGPTISGTASLSVTPKATCRVLFLFYDVSGPYVDAIPYAPITIYYYTTTTSDRWYIYLKFKIKAGVTMAGWLKSTVGVGSYSKQLADWTLKSWSGYW